MTDFTLKIVKIFSREPPPPSSSSPEEKKNKIDRYSFQLNDLDSFQAMAMPSTAPTTFIAATFPFLAAASATQQPQQQPAPVNSSTSNLALSNMLGQYLSASSIASAMEQQQQVRDEKKSQIKNNIKKTKIY